MEPDVIQIQGGCHCRNIGYVLNWPASCPEIPARECGCTFCRKHGGAWTSHTESALAATIDDELTISRYRFGTSTAEFYLCSQCGVVPFVISDIEHHLFAVVNVNTFDDTDTASLVWSRMNFDAEDLSGRLERRRHNWIPRVQISVRK